jgi:hypothetical protein
MSYERFYEMANSDIFKPIKLIKTAIGMLKDLAKHIITIYAKVSEGSWLSASDFEILQEIVTKEAKML